MKLQNQYKAALKWLKGFEGVREEAVSEVVKDWDNYKSMYENEVRKNNNHMVTIASHKRLLEKYQS